MENQLTDFGAKIGGARKDIRGNMTKDDIWQMTPEERLKLVKKDVVWPTPNYVTMVQSEGYTDRGAAMVKMMRDCFPACASVDPKATEEKLTQGAQLFVEMLNAAKSIAQKGKTEKEIGAAFREAPEAKEFFYDASLYQPPESWQPVELRVKPAKRFNDVMEGAFRGSRDISSDILRVMRCVAEGKLDYKSERMLRFNSQWPEGTSRVETWLRKEYITAEPVGGEWAIQKYRKPIQESSSFFTETLKPMGLEALAKKTFASEAEAKEHITKIAELKFAQKSSELKAKREKFLEKALGKAVASESPLVERIGPDHREQADVRGSDYLQKFGMRGGEYGLWVNQEERQEVTNKGYDAFCDLADTFKLPAEAPSLGGTLAIAFGARGRGGWAAATYNPGRRVINLTKPSGEGCLGHEWGHALDHWLGGRVVAAGILDRVKDTGQATFLSNSMLKAVSPLRHETAETKYLRDFHAAMEGIWVNTGPVTKEEVLEISKKNRDAELRNMMIALNNMCFRLRDNPERQATVKGIISTLFKPDAENNIDTINHAVDQVLQIPEIAGSGGRYEVARYHQAAVTSMAQHNEKIALPADWTGPSKVRRTSYWGQVTSLDADRQSPYWSLPEEMFARAFESVLQDTLSEQGRSNYFLISTSAGLAYPQGIERAKLKQRIGPLIERLPEFLPVLAPRIEIEEPTASISMLNETNPKPELEPIAVMKRPTLPDKIEKSIQGMQMDLL